MDKTINWISDPQVCGTIANRCFSCRPLTETRILQSYLGIIIAKILYGDQHQNSKISDNAWPKDCLI